MENLLAQSRASPGSYTGQVQEVLPREGVARLVPDDGSFSVLVRLEEFLAVGVVGAAVEFDVGLSGDVIAVHHCCRGIH